MGEDEKMILDERIDPSIVADTLRKSLADLAKQIDKPEPIPLYVSHPPVLPKEDLLGYLLRVDDRGIRDLDTPPGKYVITKEGSSYKAEIMRE